VSVAEDPQAQTETEVSGSPEPELELKAALARESELRAALVDAHRRRLESEDRLTGRLDAVAVDAQALRDQLARAEERALAERVRRERLERLLPMWVLKRSAELPLLRTLRARRARAFERALGRARGEGG
jgi:hypothetical protein